MIKSSKRLFIRIKLCDCVKSSSAASSGLFSAPGMFLRSGFIFPKSIWRCRVPVSECEHPPHARRRPADRPPSPLSARCVLPRASAASSRPAPGEASPPQSPRNAAITGWSRLRPTCVFGCWNAAQNVSAHFNYEFVGVSFWCSALFVQSSPCLATVKRLFFNCSDSLKKRASVVISSHFSLRRFSAQISWWRIHRTNVNWELQYKSQVLSRIKIIFINHPVRAPLVILTHPAGLFCGCKCSAL